MARPREFDESSALDAAMRQFWSRGYAATSTQQLCDATGLGRSSVYNTFGSKRDLFLAALAHYIDVHNAEVIALLESDRPPRDRIAALVDRTVADCRDPESPGCLVVNTGMEMGGKDAAVDALLRRDHECRVVAVTAVVREGQRDGTVAADRDPVSTAEFLVAALGGIRLALRSGARPASLRALADTALRVL